MSTNEGCFVIPGWGTVEPVLPELVYDDQSRSYSFWEPIRRQLDFQTELHLRKAFISGRWDANRNSEADIQILIFRRSGFMIDRDTIAEDWEDLRAEVEGCLYCQVLGKESCEVVACLHHENERLVEGWDRMRDIEREHTDEQTPSDLRFESWARRHIDMPSLAEPRVEDSPGRGWWDRGLSDSVWDELSPLSEPPASTWDSPRPETCLAVGPLCQDESSLEKQKGQPGSPRNIQSSPSTTVVA